MRQRIRYVCTLVKVTVPSADVMKPGPPPSAGRPPSPCAPDPPAPVCAPIAGVLLRYAIIIDVTGTAPWPLPTPPSPLRPGTPRPPGAPQPVKSLGLHMPAQDGVTPPGLISNTCMGRRAMRKTLGTNAVEANQNDFRARGKTWFCEDLVLEKLCPITGPCFAVSYYVAALYISNDFIANRPHKQCNINKDRT